MARVQLVIPDEDRDRFFHQARREGMTLSAWLRTAARERLEEQRHSNPFKSSAEIKKFFQACDALEGPEVEPEWNTHLDVITQSRRRGASNT